MVARDYTEGQRAKGSGFGNKRTGGVLRMMEMLCIFFNVNIRVLLSCCSFARYNLGEKL